MSDHVHATADAFFAEYARNLLARDAAAIAGQYAVPALVVFPGQSLTVTSREQTEQFFLSAFGQYDGVADTSADLTIVASTAHSIWADVTWSHDTGATERMMYQLTADQDDWRVSVLTPLS